jgi:hypothetical protein
MSMTIRLTQNFEEGYTAASVMAKVYTTNTIGKGFPAYDGSGIQYADTTSAGFAGYQSTPAGFGRSYWTTKTPRAHPQGTTGPRCPR